VFIDLHTHSNFSDGVLSPQALVERAAQRGVSLLALTDHDTMAGTAAAVAAGGACGVRVLPSVELSCLWRGHGVHVVGLALDGEDAALNAVLQGLCDARVERLLVIAACVEQAGVADFLAETRARLVGLQAPGRAHLAQWLIERGAVDSAQTAFKKFLGKGARAYVPSPGVSLDVGVAALRAAGGVACLAHPARYVQSNGQLRKLLGDFVGAGGEAMEVSTSGDNGQIVEKLATLAGDFGLLASVGSDFHLPGLRWRDLGRYLPLPVRCRPVAERWLSSQ
jgi:3',5'-nucleoside bisphosphate phosphatase